MKASEFKVGDPVLVRWDLVRDLPASPGFAIDPSWPWAKAIVYVSSPVDVGIKLLERRLGLHWVVDERDLSTHLRRAGEFRVGEDVDIRWNQGRSLPASPLDEPDDTWPWFPARVAVIEEHRIGLEQRDGQLWGNGVTHWWVLNINFPFVRSAVRKVEMALGCIHCKEVFPYPNEYNVVGGRLCWECKQTNAWAYTALGSGG